MYLCTFFSILQRLFLCNQIQAQTIVISPHSIEIAYPIIRYSTHVKLAMNVCVTLHQRMISESPIILCEIDYHMCSNCHLKNQILTNWLEKRLIEEGALHCNYVSNQCPQQLMFTQRNDCYNNCQIQNSAIEMCASPHVTLLYSTCTALGLHYIAECVMGRSGILI